MSADTVPAFEGERPIEQDSRLAPTSIPSTGVLTHGQRVYVLVEAHVGDVSHPEVIEDGVRVGIRRQQKLKPDSAWRLGDVEGGALAKLMRRRSTGQAELPLPDSDLRDEVVTGLGHLLDEAHAIFPAAPDDPGALAE